MRNATQRIQQQAEALDRATTGTSIANYHAIIEGFSAKGIRECDITPRVNVLNFNAWRAVGRTVRRGEHGVQVVSWIPCTGKPDDEGNRTAFKRPKTATVFHISQTEELS